jgi:hypothetical protein
MVARAIVARSFVSRRFDDEIGDLAAPRQRARVFAIVAPTLPANAVKRVCHASVASWLPKARLERAADRSAGPRPWEL